jgi:predicted RNA-binding Zn ribbon-like protein
MNEMQHREPGGREPAPGALRLVQAFINTIDLEGGADETRDPETLRRWLRGRALIGESDSVGQADVRLVIQVREALRALARANHAGIPDESAVEKLNRCAEGLRLTVRFEGDGRARLEPTLPGVDGAVARILGIVYASMVDGSWVRLKACRRGSCQWVFYDRSKNHSSNWCSMRICGNREKARTYRMRSKRRAGA